MSTNQNECILQHLAETKNYKGLLECGFATKKEIEVFKTQDRVQKAIDVLFRPTLNERQKSDKFITALAGK